MCHINAKKRCQANQKIFHDPQGPSDNHIVILLAHLLQMYVHIYTFTRYTPLLFEINSRIE